MPFSKINDAYLLVLSEDAAAPSHAETHALVKVDCQS